MPHRKVYAADDDANLHELDAATEDPVIDGFHAKSSTLRPKSSSRLSSKLFVRACRRYYRRVLKFYRKLPWTTRETFSVLISLHVVLYIFFSVPFRIAFYYNPFQHTEAEKIHRWTEELSIFTTLDIVADVIGFVEFVAFYQVWKDAFSLLSASVSFELGKKLTRDANRLKVPKVMIRSAPSSGLRRGKAKWTLASIGPSSMIQGGDASFQRHFVLVRNLQLVVEIIALLPMEVIPFSTRAYNALHLARITKIGRIYRLNQCLERIANIYSDRAWVQHLSSTGIDSLVRNIVLCAGLCHYVACGYMLIAHAQCGVSLEACDEDVETSWVIRDRLTGATVARKYARTLYWASRTIVLLGYDDVTPVSNAETIYAVAVTLLGALFGTSLLATFLFIFRFRNARYAAFATHVDNAREYMRSQNITRSVRRQVIAYFSYSWSTHHSLDSEEALHLMPKHLQTKIIASLKASRVKQVCFLMKESVEFINLLALALVHRVYSPADQITEPKFNAQMFFVIRGTVVLSAFNGSNAKECQTGDFFADSCLLFPENYEEKAIAKTFCELYVLAKGKFDEAVTHFHRGSEREVRDRMIETLDKYSTQLRKTKKLLGLRGGHESGGGTFHGGSSRNLAEDSHSGEMRRGVNWRMPGSVFRAYWDTARMLAIVYVAFEVPYFSVFIAMTDDQGMFVEEPEFGMRYALTLMTETFFAADLVLRSRYFAYLDQSVMLEVVQPDMIFAAYQASGFYYDLLAWLPVGVVLDSLPVDTTRGRLSLLRLLRLLRVRDIPSLLRDFCDYCSISSKTHIVIFLLLGVSLMLHVVGCVWFEMAWVAHETIIEDANQEVLSDLSRDDCLQHATRFQNCSWVTFDCYAHIGDVFPLQDPSSMYKSSFAYLRSVYWAIVTLTGVGYGDIVAYSTAESYFAAFWIFVGGIINFGVVGAMSSTISNAMAPRHHHIEKLNTLNSILERMDISEKLSAEIRRFYHHQFVEHKHAYESQLLSHLPDQLCYQISSLLHSDAVKSVSLFDSASVEFLHEVTGKFRHRSFQHGETICLEGDICREFFVFLHGSKVNVFFHIRKVPVRALHDGDCYGVSEFLLRKTFTATLTAASLVNASVMSREQFDVIQRKFAGDLNDMKEEAQILWFDQQKRMRHAVSNLERLKLQPHMMQTSTLFFQHDTTVTNSSSRGKSGKVVARDVEAIRTTFTSIWNAVITCWNIYNSVFIIFRICFHSHLHFSNGTSTVVWVADLACDLCFALDIYLRIYYFGCLEAGFENLLNRQERDVHYLHSSTFKWDLVSSLPLYAPVACGSAVASLFRLPRLIRCVDLLEYMDDVIVQIQQHFAAHNVSAYLSPAKLMILLVLTAHCVGCVFFLISEKECEHVELCWMAHDHMLEEFHHSVPILYAKAFYWAITTLLLVGSRESVPRDTAGTLWTGITCLGCTFIIGHIVGEISELILELGKETKQYKSRIASFESFAKEHDLPTTLRERVGFFFRLQFEHTEGLDLHSTVHDLSANLRLKLMLEIYGRSIALLPISRFLTASQINNLALRLQSELFIPGDNILVEGTHGSRLCTLRKGMAAVFWTNSVTSIAILMEGSLFGEIAFFLSNQQRLATVKATTSCEVLYVTKHDWRELWTTDGDLSDTQVQKHALHSILDWVHGRLHRYQRASLRTAKKAKRLLLTRQTQKSSSIRATGARARLSGSPSVMPLLSKKATSRMTLFSEIQLLEKKTQYLLLKTDALASQYRQDLADLHVRRRASSAVSTRSTRHNVSKGRNRGNTSDTRRGDAVTPTIPAINSKANFHVLQFIVDVNPINKLVRDSLPTGHVRHLETESWASFKILVAVQHTVRKLMDELIPPETASSRVTIAPSVHGGPRTRIFHSRRMSGQQSSHSFHYNGAGSGANQANNGLDSATRISMVAHSIGLGEKGPRRRLSAIELQDQPQYQTGLPPPGETAIKQVKLTRSRSLPMFGSKYFEELREEGNRNLKAREGYACRASIDFDIIQRCQRPQYATQLHLYHQYRRWKNPNHDDRKLTMQKGAANVALAKRMSSVRALGSSIRGTFQHLEPVRRASNGHRPSLTGRFQLPSDHVETIDLQSREFIKRIKELGRVWDIVMLVVAIYNLVITPFKLCFATDLTELPGVALRVWSGIEIFMDVLCVFDVGYKIRYSSLTFHSVGASLASTHQGGCRWIFVSNPALRADILAMLPLELLLFATDIRIPLAYPSNEDAAHASWWATRWLLRMNRLLLVQRIEPLSEELFQFMIYDRKIPANEAFLYFLKGLTSYLTMGHLLACLWFVTSEAAFHHYGTSWLSTSGMLTFIADGSEIEDTARMLSEGATTFYLESVSLTRKYLRSLLFSMECISTLFYGDIVSMNPMELVAEIAITLWSIYIYGALVGAQGELLNARARREAAFEQSLGEMQRYLVQNEVPKKLKRQIKSYYARVWRRRKGEKEFAAVAHVSHTLHEDVVLATLREFAGRVTAFRSLDDHFLRGLLVCLHYVVCSEGEEVAMKGDVDRSMYFIAQGRVLVKLDSGESIRERGEFFGELALLYGVSRLETCVALVLTELYRLDHQPYERLLQDFPEYRERNKVAWTSPNTAAPDRDMLEEMMLSYQRGRKRSENSPVTIPALNSDDVVANAERINADLPYSHIYKFIMELLAQLQRVDPLEARDLVIQGSAGARKHLKSLLGLATSRDEISHKEEPIPAPPSPGIELVSTFRSRGDEEPNDQHDNTPLDESVKMRRGTAAGNELLFVHSLSYTNLLD